MQRSGFFQPRIRLVNKIGSRVETAMQHHQGPFQNLKLYDKISKALNSLHIARVEMIRGSLSAHSGEAAPVHFPSIDATLENFRLDSLAEDRLGQFLYSEEFEADIHGFYFPTADSMYFVGVKNAQISSCESSMQIDSLQLIPRYGMYAFTRKLGYSTDRIEIEIPKLSLKNLDVHALVYRQQLRAHKLIFDKPYFDIFRDRHLPNPENYFPRMPQQTLRELGTYVWIDTVQMADGDIRFREHAPDGEEPGEFYFRNIKASIIPLTNDPVFLAREQEAIINAQTRIMETGLLRVRFFVPYGDTNNAHSFTGILGPMEAKDLNPIFEPVAFVSIKSGKVKKLIFNVEADNYNSKGRIRFYYNDLKLTVLNKKRGNEKGFETFLANSVMVRSNNPSGKYLRIGKISYDRNPQKAIFNYWYKSLLTGIGSSIGLKGKKERIKNRFRIGWGSSKKEPTR